MYLSITGIKLRKMYERAQTLGRLTRERNKNDLIKVILIT